MFYVPIQGRANFQIATHDFVSKPLKMECAKIL
jgi:hypothetical protein